MMTETRNEAAELWDSVKSTVWGHDFEFSYTDPTDADSSEAGLRLIEEAFAKVAATVAGGAPNGHHLLRAIRGSHNTLMGWLRQMDGYDDEAMIAALEAAWNRPDPRPALIRRMAAYYTGEVANLDEVEPSRRTPPHET